MTGFLRYLMRIIIIFFTDFPSLGGGGKVTRRPVARSGRSAQWAANLARARDRYSQIQVRNGGKSRHASVRGEARLAVHPSLVPRGQSGGGGGRKQKQKQRSGGPVPAPRPMPRAARVGSSGATTTKTKAAVSSMASALKARPPQPAPRSGSGGPSAAWLLRGGGASSNRSAAKQQQQQQQRRYVPPSASSTEAYPVVSSRRCCAVNSLCTGVFHKIFVYHLTVLFSFFFLPSFPPLYVFLAASTRCAGTGVVLVVGEREKQ